MWAPAPSFNHRDPTIGHILVGTYCISVTPVPSGSRFETATANNCGQNEHLLLFGSESKICRRAGPRTIPSHTLSWRSGTLRQRLAVEESNRCLCAWCCLAHSLSLLFSRTTAWVQSQALLGRGWCWWHAAWPWDSYHVFPQKVLLGHHLQICKYSHEKLTQISPAISKTCSVQNTQDLIQVFHIPLKLNKSHNKSQKWITKFLAPTFHLCWLSVYHPCREMALWNRPPQPAQLRYSRGKPPIGASEA